MNWGTLALLFSSTINTAASESDGESFRAVEGKTAQFNTHKRISWDYFTLSQIWPPTFCHIHKFQDISDASKRFEKCNLRPNITGWTVHGLWPTKASGDVTNCSSSFSWKQIKTLYKQLESHWPNLDNPRGNWFWKHEWIRHGSCSTDLPATGNEYLYFKKALTLNKKFDIQRALDSHNITPSWTRSYNTRQIEEAIMTAFKMTTKPGMTILGAWNKPVLYQIELCLNKTFAFVPCRKPHAYKPVFIPPYPTAETSKNSLLFSSLMH